MGTTLNTPAKAEQPSVAAPTSQTAEKTAEASKTARTISPEHRRKLSEAMRGNSNAKKAPAIETAIIVKRAQGETKAQIARDLDIRPETVGRILNAAEVDEQVKAGRSRCVEMIPKALVAVESGLDKRDWRAGLGLLRGTNVLSNGSGPVSQTNVAANVWVQMRAAREAELSGTEEPKPLAITAAVPLPGSTE